jgi:NAD(P)-dependent dehydrogenase (short-subunit alcohol dehydrogenase family)
MKFMVTGGNRGLGLELAQKFQGDSYSRSNGYDITKDVEKLAEISLDYDVFINNAFDGPFQESWANFAQVNMLYAVANYWQKYNKTGHIINIGSIGSESIVAPDPLFETYRVSKAALKAHSQQWTRAFKENRVQFKTTLLTLDRLDTELSRSRSSWTGNGIDLQDVCNYVDLLINSKSNTCVGEIIAWVNFDHKQQ